MKFRTALRMYSINKIRCDMLPPDRKCDTIKTDDGLLDYLSSFLLGLSKKKKPFGKNGIGSIEVARYHALSYVIGCEASPKGGRNNKKYTVQLKWDGVESPLEEYSRHVNCLKQFLRRWVETKEQSIEVRTLSAMTLLAIGLQIKENSGEQAVFLGDIEIAVNSQIDVMRILAQIEDMLIGAGRTYRVVFATYATAPITAKLLMPEAMSSEVITGTALTELQNDWPIVYSRSIDQTLYKGMSLQERQTFYQKIAKLIIASAVKYPVLSEVIKTTPDNDKRIENIRRLLQSVCTIKTGTNGNALVPQITINPIVSDTMKRFADSYSSKDMKDKPYTRQDVLQSFAKAADILSKCPDYKLEAQEFFSRFEPGAEREMLQDILKNTDTIHQFIEIQDDCCRFIHKQLRLTFLGIYHALIAEEERYKNNQPVDKQMNQLMDEIKVKQPDRHTQWDYSQLVIAGTSMLMALSHTARAELIDYLRALVRDHSALNRDKQERALHILSYYLTESQGELTNQQRIDIFHDTYSQDSYELQTNMWKYLAKTQVYKAAIAKSFDDVFLLDSDRQADPSYFFMWWALAKDKKYQKESPEGHLLEACRLQHDSWHGDLANWSYDKFLESVKTAVCQILKNEYRLAYIFTLNALLYAAANMKNVFSSKHWDHAEEIQSKALTGRDADTIREAVIVCDFWTRVTCKSYNALLEGKAETTYMLSGATRFLAAYQPNWSAYELSEEQQHEYSFYYQNEKNARWKFLLYRTLSSTNMVNKIDAPTEDEYNRAHFLAYDNIPESWELYCKKELRPKQAGTEVNTSSGEPT